MRKMKLMAAVVFLTGFWGVLYAAAQHGNHSHEDHSVTPAAAGAENDQVAIKKEQEASINPGRAEKDGGRMKEKAVKAALQKHNCLLCHKYKGKGGTSGPALDGHLRHHSKGQLKNLLKYPKQPMPPFPGTGKELDEFINTLIPASAGSGVDGKPAVKQIMKTYVCPMGEYQGSKPGKCPKCGMGLVEKK